VVSGKQRSTHQERSVQESSVVEPNQSGIELLSPEHRVLQPFPHRERLHGMKLERSKILHFEMV